MINLHNANKIGKKMVVSTCLLAFIGGHATPLAASTSYQSGIAANTTAPVEQAKSETPKNVILKGEVSLAKGNQKVAVSLRDSDVKQVLRMFADKAGLNIVFHKSVEGKITLDLVNVTLNDAFNMIMDMAELTYIIENDTLLVASSEEAKNLNFTKENMSAVPVKYIDANKAATFLNKNIFTKGRPGLSNTEIAVSNPRENEVLIFGSKSDFKIAQKVIEELDKPLRITTYKVNHTTPKEMATLICDTWLEDKGTEGDELEDNSDTDIVIGGGVIACSIDSEDESQGEMESLKTQGLKIAYFPTQGVVKLYGGTVQQAEDMKKFIADADKKQPQAILEMSIIELSENGSKTINNTWTIYSRFFTGSLGGSAGINNSIDGYPMVWHAPHDKNFFYDVLNPSGTPIAAILKWTGAPIITTNINWVIQNGDARVLATPKVMITNGQESVIDMTSDYIASVTTQYLDTGTTAGAQVQKTYNIANDNGMKITLTPFISPDGYVAMNIKPEYATISGRVTDENGDPQATMLQRRNLELKNIRIKDGETLVIGGLIREDETKTVTKPPILGDIPGIGWIFRSTNNQKTKNELVIMLTPHIIKDAEDLVESPEIEAL